MYQADDTIKLQTVYERKDIPDAKADGSKVAHTCPTVGMDTLVGARTHLRQDTSL